MKVLIVILTVLMFSGCTGNNKVTNVLITHAEKVCELNNGLSSISNATTYNYDDGTSRYLGDVSCNNGAKFSLDFVE